MKKNRNCGAQKRQEAEDDVHHPDLLLSGLGPEKAERMWSLGYLGTLQATPETG